MQARNKYDSEIGYHDVQMKLLRHTDVLLLKWSQKVFPCQKSFSNLWWRHTDKGWRLLSTQSRTKRAENWRSIFWGEISTREAMCVSRNIKARARNYCCRQKAVNIKYLCACACICVRGCTGACAPVALLIQHATRRHIAICSLSGSTIFFDII